MPRPLRIFSAAHPYHVTARCINRDWFKIPKEIVWSLFCDHLYFATHAYTARIHAFVLMSNHFHLIVSTPEANIDKIMWYLMTEVSRGITLEAGRINQTFGGPYYASLIRSDHYYLHAYKYLYRNPVDAQLAERVEDYKYSTLNALLGRSSLSIPLLADDLLFENIERTLAWLNTDYKMDDREHIRLALRKKEFQLPLIRNRRERNHLEIERS
jgi:putative transposase